MKAPPVPRDEAERLLAVQALDILDTPEEDAFDRITRMVASVMEVPIACVTIVDKDRQWFKSRVGLETKETPRRISFCGHVINSKNLFIVSNAHEDDRFKDNPLVSGAPNIAFYIGVPVLSPDGHAVGTLCAIDNAPKMPTEEQQQLLKDLAHMVEAELTLRQESSTDPLSGLANRRMFIRLAQRELARVRRLKQPVAMMLIDVDHFKEINDKLGHEKGDELIAALGEALNETIKRPGDAVARLGGDEFVALLVDTDHQGAELLAERVKAKLDEALIRLVGRQHKPRPVVSIGAVVCRADLDCADLSHLLKAADAAMYACKQDEHGEIVVRDAAPLDPKAARRGRRTGPRLSGSCARPSA